MEDNKRDQPYKYRQDNEPHRQTGNINERNNNMNVSTPAARDPELDQTIETANDAGIGDAGWNDEKLSKKTQNHSADA